MVIQDSFSDDEKLKIIQRMRSEQSHYETYLHKLAIQGWDVSPIRETVTATLDKVKGETKSFVIYGEPQSGKTGMMIGLVSKLIEEGYDLIIILLNDSLKLLDQNLKRFIESGIKPTPRVATEIYGYGLTDDKYILFCKKNIKDLDKLSELVKSKKKILIDDEADYATPNAKINKDTRTAVNRSISNMMNDQTIYIGVTATPARLDLNNTLDTDNEKWVIFKPHRDYVGKNDFFLADKDRLGYQYNRISNNEKRDLQIAVVAFIVNATYLNCLRNGHNLPPENYCMLIHTSGEKVDHKTDGDIVRNICSALSSPTSQDHDRMIEEAERYINSRPEIKAFGVNSFLELIKQDVNSYEVVTLNSNHDTRGRSTTPMARYTFYIGGNVVSRGVTFDNLLSMFFTRTAKKVQQDTYIQRARMFGSRKTYLQYFQLWIGDSLFKDWQTCFVYHYISLETLKTTETAPIWLSGERILPTAPSSIDKRSVFTKRGEVVSPKFDFSSYEQGIGNILINAGISELEKLKQIRSLGVTTNFLNVIIQFIQLTSGDSQHNVNILPIRSVKIDSEFHDDLYRPDGTMGGHDYIGTKKDHHILIVKNSKNEARVIYRYSPEKIRFFSNLGVLS